MDSKRELALERDRSAVGDAGGMQRGDRAPQDATLHRQPAIRTRELQFDQGPREEAMVGLDERAAGREVHHRHLVPGPDPRTDDPMLLGGLPSSAGSPIGGAAAGLLVLFVP